MTASPGAIEPRQRRSRDTMKRLLDATEELLQERPLEDIAVGEIVRRARSSVGSFYARFPAKQALVAALLERYHQDARASLAELRDDPAWQAASLGERVERYISGVVGLCRRRRGLLRLRLEQRLSRGEDRAVAAESGRNRELVEAIGELFQPCLDEIRHRDPERSLAFALRSVDAVASSSILLDDVYRSFGAVEDTRLVEELVGMFLAYLGSGRPAAPGRSTKGVGKSTDRG